MRQLWRMAPPNQSVKMMKMDEAKQALANGPSHEVESAQHGGCFD
jgi:hypothetical protein